MTGRLAASKAKRSVDNVEVKESEMFGGGMGLFSTRNFEKGDVVLMEKPFLTIPGGHMDQGMIRLPCRATIISEGRKRGT